ncbi:MAG TPA: YfhO family protein [Myxococcales bacterium]|nr:YfhO family protein [Myxococcales bacterium]
MRPRLRRRSLLLWAGLLAGLLFVHRPALLGKVMAGRDAFRLFIPDSVLLLQSLRQGEWPLWNPYLRLGQPFAATLQSEAFYPPEIGITLAFGPYVGFTVHHALHVAAAAVGTFLLARRLRVSVAGSVLSSAAFALSPMLADLHGQRNVVDAACWTPFLVLGALGVARRASAAAAAWLAAGLAGSFLCGSPETLLWQVLLVGAVVGWSARQRRRAVAGAALGAGAWGAALAGLLLVPGVEYALNSSRGDLEGTLEWSASWSQLASMVLPFADQPRDQYWGEDEWFVVTLFAGSIACALAALSFRRSRRVWPFAVGAVVLGLLALGRHFPPAAWVLSVPPFSLFRYPAKYLVGALFCLAMLSGFGLDRTVVLLRRRRPSWRAPAIALAGTLLWLVIALPLSRAPVFRPGLSSGVFWAALAVGLAAALALGLPRRWRRAAVAACAMVELGAYHLMAVGTGWIEPGKLERPSVLGAEIPRPFEGRVSIDAYRPDDLTPKARPQMELSRDALWANRFVEEGFSAPEGYGAPEPKRIDEFHLSEQRAIFDLMGVQYYVRRGPAPFPDLVEVGGGGELPSLYRSETAFPRAFVVHRARPVSDREVIQRLLLPAQLARSEALLAEGDVLSSTGCVGSRAQIARATHNSIEVDAVACQDAYLVVTDSYYPGWVAEVDGREAPVVRADYALRAVPLIAGAHHVVLRYRPASFGVGLALSIVSWATFAVVMWRARRRTA